MGRPPEPVPEGVKDHRPFLRVPPPLWARLEEKAAASLRAPAKEIAVGVRAYLDANPTLPPADEPDREHGATRPRLPAELVREVDRRAGLDARERTILAAIEWWTSR